MVKNSFETEDLLLQTQKLRRPEKLLVLRLASQLILGVEALTMSEKDFDLNQSGFQILEDLV